MAKMSSQPKATTVEESEEYIDSNEVMALDGTRLIPVSELPQRYRSVFMNRFPHFNCVQSKVFEDVFHSDKTIVLCAPTSSGKTVVFELSIIKNLIDLEEANESSNCLKCVYMAPLKKLVDEKFTEFKKSFERFGLICVQFTGDSDMEDYEKLSNANIVLTTPEKWDSMVRVNQNSALIRNLQLMLIDEIHSIGDDSRGATMEAVISRMKTLRSVQLKASGGHKLRFMAASATAPNVGDIAHWLEPMDSVGYNLSESYRPVRIQVIVLGYNCAKDVTDFKFDINLNYRLDSVIRSHCDSKPTLIFCSTRKSVEMTAKTLSNSKQNYFNSFQQKTKLETTLRRFDFKDKKLLSFIKSSGIGYHHSGLDRRDKEAVERLFTDSLIPVLISTTTLSMGVNLPAHLVIIKNTTQFECNGVVREYPETLIMQMIGRAGRPQYDTTAVAVIMTKNEKRMKYEMLSNGSQIIESRLHSHLIEHLNAEIALRTVTSIDIAVDWIRSTFLYIRLLQNPNFYQKSIQITNVEQGVEVGRQWCHKELSQLKDADMIAADESFSHLTSTALGRFMARHYISFETMKKFCQIIEKELEIKEIIEEIAKSNELTQEIQIRVSDKKILNELNNEKTIRYPIEGKIKSSDMKINCLIQTTFGSETSNISDSTLIQESIRIVRTGQRLSKCLSDIMYFKTEQNQTIISFKTLLNAIILSKCFKAKLWNNSKQLTKQFQRIGDKISKKISEKYETFQQLRAADPRDVEFRAERRPPFGTQLIDWVKRLPYYSVTINQNRDGLKRNEVSVRITVKLENYGELKERIPLFKNHMCFIVVGDESNRLFRCQQLFDSKLLKNNGFYETNDILIERNDRSDYIIVHLISDSLVGLDVECRLRLEFAADTLVTPELIRTNCSTAFSDSSCEPNSRFDSSQSCQHKCVNKMSCRHNCCKKGLLSNKSETKTLKQATKTKRQSDVEQNTSKKCKQNKSEDKRPQTNLDNWLKRFPRTLVKTQSDINTESDSVANKYSEITDNDNDFDDDFDSDFFNDSQFNVENNNDSNYNIKDIKEEDIFDDEFDKLIDEQFDNKLNDFISEDFQGFDRKTNDSKNDLTVEVLTKGDKSMNSIYSEYSLKSQWSIFLPTTQLEGKTFFMSKPNDSN